MLLAVLLLAAAPSEILCEGEAAMCRTVIAAEQALTKMLATADPAPFAEHLDEQAIYVTADGRQRSKAEMIALVRGTPAHAEARLERLVVRGRGEVAVAVWTESWRDPGKGGPDKTGVISGMDTWMRQNGVWRIIATREAKDAAP